MAHFESAEFTRRFEKSFAALPLEVRRQCRKAILQVMKDPHYPGLRSKPIQPGRFHWEARLNRGDRLIFRPAGDIVYFIDVVSHDDIARYGERTGDAP